MGARDAVDSSDIARFVNDAHHDLARVLRMAGQWINSSEGSVDAYREQVLEMARELVAAQVAAQRSRQEGMDKFRSLTTRVRAEQQDALMEGLQLTLSAAESRMEIEALIERLDTGR